MQRITTIAFDRQEREIIEKGANAAMILFDYDDLRALRGVTQRGDTITYRRLRVAIDLFATLRDNVEKQTDPEFWKQIISNPTEASMATVIVEARARQTKEITDAIRVLLEAATAIPAGEREVDDETAGS